MPGPLPQPALPRSLSCQAALPLLVLLWPQNDVEVALASRDIPWYSLTDTPLLERSMSLRCGAAAGRECWTVPNASQMLSLEGA